MEEELESNEELEDAEELEELDEELKLEEGLEEEFWPVAQATSSPTAKIATVISLFFIC